MYFQRESSNSRPLIRAYDNNIVIFGHQKYSLPLCIFSEKESQPIPWSFETPSVESFDFLVAYHLDILLWGIGDRCDSYDRFLSVAQALTAGLSCEIMSTPSACRTFNVLSLEGRRVAAVLFST